MHLVKKLILVAVKMQVSFKPVLNRLDAKFIPEIPKNPNFWIFPGRLVRNPK